MEGHMTLQSCWAMTSGSLARRTREQRRRRKAFPALECRCNFDSRFLQEANFDKWAASLGKKIPAGIYIEVPMDLFGNVNDKFDLADDVLQDAISDYHPEGDKDLAPADVVVLLLYSKIMELRTERAAYSAYTPYVNPVFVTIAVFACAATFWHDGWGWMAVPWILILAAAYLFFGNGGFLSKKALDAKQGAAITELLTKNSILPYLNRLREKRRLPPPQPPPLNTQ